LWAWLTVRPTTGFFPQTSQLFAIIPPGRTQYYTAVSQELRSPRDNRSSGEEENILYFSEKEKMLLFSSPPVNSSAPELL
jgi:hypothetical protein